MLTWLACAFCFTCLAPGPKLGPLSHVLTCQNGSVLRHSSDGFMVFVCCFWLFCVFLYLFLLILVVGFCSLCMFWGGFGIVLVLLGGLMVIVLIGVIIFLLFWGLGGLLLLSSAGFLAWAECLGFGLVLGMLCEAMLCSCL